MSSLDTYDAQHILGQPRHQIFYNVVSRRQWNEAVRTFIVAPSWNCLHPFSAVVHNCLQRHCGCKEMGLSVASVGVF